MTKRSNTRGNALGISFGSLASGTIGRHISSIYRISQVCDAIIYEFQYVFMEFTNENWLRVANEFKRRWNCPNCLGSIDGKHIAITCPKHSGTLFYNYKKFYSIGGIFGLDRIGRQIYGDELPLPPDTEIDGCKVPFHFIADDAFTLGKRIMKPYKPHSRTVLKEEEKIFRLCASTSKLLPK
ncbi:uncharacterized protein LOC118739808 [Rhagoletis pomonella]|uniref:uncharacterized protein LOC118739808 n=1 Tax=Rhagoletis pomonella TaxID=28610 RepID=UPI00177E2088|nr:uncharacterized protein LOC118739808 [Rhagoletis pomonella]